MTLKDKRIVIIGGTSGMGGSSAGALPPESSDEFGSGSGSFAPSDSDSSGAAW